MVGWGGEHYGVEGMDGEADRLGTHWVAWAGGGYRLGRDSSEGRVVGRHFLLTNSEQDLSCQDVCGVWPGVYVRNAGESWISTPLCVPEQVLLCLCFCPM